LVVIGVTPALGGARGGFNVKVAGRNFLSSPFMRCRFTAANEDVIQARTAAGNASLIIGTTVGAYTNAGEIICKSPTPTVAQWVEAAEIMCQQTVNGTAVLQKSSTAITTSMLTPCVAGTEAMCHFTQGLPRQFKTCTSILRTVLSVSMDGQLFTTTQTPYTFVGHPVLTGIAPTSGSSAGGSTLTVAGWGFYPNQGRRDDGALCQFGSTGLQSAANITTVNEARCVVGNLGSKRGSIPIKLSQNGIEFEPFGFGFSVFAPLPVGTPLSPAKGLLTGGYEVALNGDAIAGGSAYGVRLFRNTYNKQGFVTQVDNVTLVCKTGKPVAVLGAIKAKWDGLCTTIPALCTATAGANGRVASEQREVNALKASILCPMPNLTKHGWWKPGKLAVHVSGNGVDWEKMSKPFVTLPEPNPCGLTCSKGDGARLAPPRQSYLALAALLACAAALR